jgi:hypothetical protein
MQKSEQFNSDPFSALMKSLKEDAGTEENRALPPVHLWNPEHCGDIRMEIRKDGSWWHEGTRITREKLVRLFSTILRKDDDGIYLVTPHEKVIVHVEDAPFIAVRIEKSGSGEDQKLIVTTNVGDVFVVDEDHPIRVQTDPKTQEPAPYVEVRNGLEAKIGRNPFYNLVEWAETDTSTNRHTVTVTSSGVTFELGTLDPE